MLGVHLLQWAFSKQIFSFFTKYLFKICYLLILHLFQLKNKIKLIVFILKILHSYSIRKIPHFPNAFFVAQFFFINTSLTPAFIELFYSFSYLFLSKTGWLCITQKATYQAAATMSCPISCPWHMVFPPCSFSFKTLLKTTSFSCIALIPSLTPIKLFMWAAGRDGKVENWTAHFICAAEHQQSGDAEWKDSFSLCQVFHSMNTYLHLGILVSISQIESICSKPIFNYFS